MSIISTAKACCQSPKKYHTCDRDTILHLGHTQRIPSSEKQNLLGNNVFLGTTVDVSRVNVGGFGVSFLVALMGLKILILSKTTLYN